MALALTVLMLSACGSSEKSKLPELPNVSAQIGIRQVWKAQIGPTSDLLRTQVQGQTLLLASTTGQVRALDVSNGRELWSFDAGQPIVAGVGSDANIHSVILKSNEVLVFSQGRELWRHNLGGLAFTAPLVAGGRVFVQTADRVVVAFDAQTGRELWKTQRTGDPLVLKQPGVLQAVGNTLVTGFSGRLAGLNPDNGATQWEVPLASSRSTNDVERLVDLVAGTSRTQDSLCARAFQSTVGCVQLERGVITWSKPSQGYTGLHGDQELVVGTESDGRVLAWKRENGERLWTNEFLQRRRLGAPLLLGRSMVVGDGYGYLHFLSREDGHFLHRVSTDDSAIAMPPVLSGKTLVVVTSKGTVLAFEPE